MLAIYDAAKFVRSNSYENFLMSLEPGEEYDCHNDDTINKCKNNTITTLSALGIIEHFLGGGFKLAATGSLVQEYLKSER